MALVNMANVLHKHGFTQNATILLETAIDIYPGSSLNHFSVSLFFGVAYAMKYDLFMYKWCLDSAISSMSKN